MIAHPRHRQVGEQLVAGLEAVERRAGLGRPHEVVVAQHRALRPAGRAGGVEHDGVVRAAALGDLGRNRVRRRRQQAGAAFLHLGVGRQPLVVPHPARVDIHHDAKRGHLLLDREQLVDLLLVLGQGKARAAMLDDVGQLLGDRVLVDRHRHAAQRLRRAHRPVEPGPVVADHDQPVAAAEAEVGQARGQQTDLLGDMAPVIGLPDAVFLLAVGGLAGTLQGKLRQKLGKRIPSVGPGACRCRRHPCLVLPGPPVFGPFRPVIFPARSSATRFGFCGDFVRQIAIVNSRRSSQPPVKCDGVTRAAGGA